MTQFYRAFEDEHRGSREAIKQRLQIYLPFIRPLLDLYPDARALDVGCGRGEWLETLVENGFKATGVDMDDGMLEACRARNLPAEKADALSFLQTIPSDSYCVLTGFHIAEHLRFDDLKALVAQAHRVLKPGGLLILETPNSENLIVATQNFYLDPTHERPIPHLLLDFLVRFSGFQRSKILRLQENPALSTTESISLMDVIGGTSPDYAIIAQVDLGDFDSTPFEGPFSEVYGLSMEELARRYDLSNGTRAVKALYVALADRVNALEMHQLELTNQILNADSSATTSSLAKLEQENTELQRSLEEALTNIQHWQNEANLQKQNFLQLKASASYHEQAHGILAKHVQEFKSSTSWRITAPMRLARSILSSPTRTLKHIVKASLKILLKQPSLVKLAKKILNQAPALNAFARKVAARLNAEAAYTSHAVQFSHTNPDSAPQPAGVPAAPDHLTENAKAIYYRLNINTSRKDQN
ncbi:class I SAM-dependent methyltransferase [Pseudomonas mosselii]|uniref:class I SAM-dependent methyltransferase n=1 Tax=Pseudomonas mosselii TaxID=78327 RepID=UPI000D88AF49|nr:class I SAM-dependent methyltransferase [Pseudomonas mosselii]PYC22947.1 class I SAM-dependent methyltransferase [Pseudomonas mosselii]